MLIINADDMGRNAHATDAILSCYQQARINSASAMVYMADSARAAEAALASGIEVGLHLNFSEIFTGPGVPPALRRAHDRVRVFLTRSRYALLLFHPLLCRPFRQIYNAQCQEFLRLHQREPSHYDGHQHLHLATNCLVQQLLPAGAKVRRNLSFGRGEKPWLNRVYRAAVDHQLARRHQLVDFIFSLGQNNTAASISRIIALAQHSDVELLTHPGRPAEYDFLTGAEFGRLLSHLEVTDLRS